MALRNLRNVLTADDFRACQSHYCSNIVFVTARSNFETHSNFERKKAVVQKYVYECRYKWE